MTVGTGVCRLGGRASSRIAVVGDGEPRCDSRAGGGAEVKKGVSRQSRGDCRWCLLAADGGAAHGSRRFDHYCSFSKHVGRDDAPGCKPR